MGCMHCLVEQQYYYCGWSPRLESCEDDFIAINIFAFSEKKLEVRRILLKVERSGKVAVV